MRSRPLLYRGVGREEFPALEELPSNQWLELAIFGDWGPHLPFLQVKYKNSFNVSHLLPLFVYGLGLISDEIQLRFRFHF